MKLIPFKYWAVFFLVAAAAVFAPKTGWPVVSNTTVSTTTGYGAGSQTNYPITFDFRDNSEVVVTQYDTSTNPVTVTTIVQGGGAGKFTISGGNPGTTVVMGTAPSLTQYEIFTRTLPLTQPVVFSAAGVFPYQGISNQLDLMTLEMQNLNASIGGSPGAGPSGVPITSPSPLANNFWGWDASGSVASDIPGNQSTFNLDDVIAWNGTGWGVQNMSPLSIMGYVNDNAGSYAVSPGAGGTGATNTGIMAWNHAIVWNTSAYSNLTLPTSGTLIAGTLSTGNSPGTIPIRDGSGNFSAGTISSNLTGNVTGNLTGNVTGNTSGTAANVTGVVAIGNGGTGQTTQPAALTALTGTQTANQVVMSNGTNTLLQNLPAAALPTVPWSKMAQQTANSVLTTDGSGNESPLPVGANGTILQSNGTTMSWNFVTSTAAVNLMGGTSGSVPYQTGANTTSFLPIGTTGQVMAVASGVPTWTTSYPMPSPSPGGIAYATGGTWTDYTGTISNSTTGNAATATTATTATNSSNTLITTSSGNSNYPVVLAPTSSTGQQSLLMDTDMTYNPSTDMLTLPGNVSATNVYSAGFVSYGVSTVAAAGVNQGGATALTTSEVNISSGAANSGVILPSTPTTNGLTVTITNSTGNTLYVYPPSGSTIDGQAANASVVLPGGQTIALTLFSSGTWSSTGNTMLGGTGIALTHGAGGISFNLNTPVSVANGGIGLSSTSQNYAFMGPTSGSGAPTWRALVSGDIPNNAANTSGTSASFTGSLTGDVTSTGMATSVAKVNGANVPASKTIVGTNSSSQIIDASAATLANNTTGSAAKWTTARNLAGNSVDGSAAVAFGNKFVVQGTSDAGLSGAQFLGSLGTGILKNTTTTGVLSAAAASDVVALFSSCSGTQYLGADGGCHTGSGSGTVTSVTFTGDGTVLSSTPSSAVTTSGTVTATIKNQSAGTFLAGPTSGSAAAPTFRALQIPTVQRFSSGTSYTTPSGALYLRVQMVGGGGGGGGGGTSGPYAGANGTSTTWSGSGITASAGYGSGGSGGQNGNGPGAGGSNSLSGGTLIVSAAGGAGATGNGNSSGGAVLSNGSAGGSSYYGGAGGGGTVNGNGTSAFSYGGGGGGAGTNGSASSYTGTGGGAGGYLEFLISSPAASYTIAIGSAGAGNTSGSLSGGTGGAGYIVVTEYYQ